LTHRLLSREKKGYFSFHLFNNLHIVFVGIKKKARRGDFGLSGELRKRSEAQTGNLFLSWLLAVCKVGGHFILLLVEVCCHWCNLRFYVCRRCWRGQAYCCEECRILGMSQVHREAQRRYRQTPKGKKAHRQGENRRRHGLSKKNEKKMDDPSSRGLPSWVIKLLICTRVLMVQGRAGFDGSRRCHFCGCRGVVVDSFPRRGWSRSPG
jgi:hypothetical protein